MTIKHRTTIFSLLTAFLIILTLAAPPAIAQGDKDEGAGIGQIRIARILLRTAAVEIGLTRRELLKELRQDGGRSIADVANEHGVSPDSIVDAFMNKASERLAQSVTKGRLTQAEADQRLAALREQVVEAINKPLPLRSK